MFSSAEIRRLIETAIPGSTAIITDDDGEHFEAAVVSPTFVGLSLVKQHQAVYAALGANMGGAIHALALKTYTPDQWARARGG